MQKKRTKIVATIGPSSQSVATLKKMLREGLDVARLNFSHGTHASHRKLIQSVRKASKEAKKNVAIMADLQGPKIRIGDLPSLIKTKKGEEHIIPVTLPQLGASLKKGDKILIDDGRCEAVYLSGKKDTITIKMLTRGEFGSHAGLAIPGLKLKGVSSITEKDVADVIFSMDQKVDWIVMSFVTEAKDVKALRKIINTHAQKGFVPKICVKIERALAVKNAASIISEADSVMIGRGDLGLDIPIEDLPVVQKDIVAMSRELGKPVIVATQMLDSMTHNRRPTRAEVSDVANAVIDHTDAVMLSGETAKGEYPVETVSMMAAIVQDTEKSTYDDILPKHLKKRAGKIETFAFMIAEMVYAGRIKALAVPEKDKEVAWAISRFRPEVPVYLIGSDAFVLRQYLLRWAVEPVRVSKNFDFDDANAIVSYLRKQKQVASGKPVTVIGFHGKNPTFQTVKAK
ncbi:MAG: pyruvate kinase [bacterium]|nr:pyruvate kinase [bacterium]